MGLRHIGKEVRKARTVDQKCRMILWTNLRDQRAACLPEFVWMDRTLKRIRALIVEIIIIVRNY